MTCYLYLNKRDPKNYSVQDYLHKRGYYKCCRTDGYYGPRTVEAVKSFQSNNKLEVDGCVGCKTWSKLVGTSCPWQVKPEPQPVPTPSKNVYVTPRYLKAKQETEYWCANLMEAQLVYELYNIKVSQSYFASVSGTTTSGTGHDGIVEGMKQWAAANKHEMEYEWINFSDTGWGKVGEWMSDPTIGLGIHCLYKNKWGHYMFPVWLSLNTNVIAFVNSLKGEAISYFGLSTVREWIRNNKDGQPSLFKVRKIK